MAMKSRVYLIFSYYFYSKRYSLQSVLPQSTQSRPKPSHALTFFMPLPKSAAIRHCVQRVSWPAFAQAQAQALNEGGTQIRVNPCLLMSMN
jgi:hypothetical protein